MGNPWGNMQLTEEEGVAVHIENKELEVDRADIESSLLAKVLTSRPTNMEAFKSTMMSLWSAVSAHEVGHNLVLFRFRSVEGKQRIQHNGPWLFDKNLVVIADLVENIPPGLISIHMASF